MRSVDFHSCWSLWSFKNSYNSFSFVKRLYVSEQVQFRSEESSRAGHPRRKHPRSHAVRAAGLVRLAFVAQWQRWLVHLTETVAVAVGVILLRVLVMVVLLMVQQAVVVVIAVTPIVHLLLHVVYLILANSSLHLALTCETQYYRYEDRPRCTTRCYWIILLRHLHDTCRHDLLFNVCSSSCFLKFFFLINRSEIWFFFFFWTNEMWDDKLLSALVNFKRLRLVSDWNVKSELLIWMWKKEIAS